MTPSIGWAVGLGHRLGHRLGRWVAVAAAGLLAIAMIRRDAARDARRDADLKAANRRGETNHDAAEKRQAVDRLGDAAVRERLRDWSRDAGGNR